MKLDSLFDMPLALDLSSNNQNFSLSFRMTDMDESQIPEFKEKTELKKSSIFGYKNKRHILTIYAFFGFFFAYALRVNLSVAIVDMVHSPVPSLKPVSSASNSTSTSQPPVKYEWSSVLQGYILASFFYGYIVTQLPAGKYYFLIHIR